MEELRTKLPFVESNYQIEQTNVWKTLFIFFAWQGLSFYLAYLSTQSFHNESKSALLWNSAILLLLSYFVALYFAGSYLIPNKLLDIRFKKDGILVNNKRMIPWSSITALRIDNNWRTLQTGFSIKVRKGGNLSISIIKPGKEPSKEWKVFSRLKTDLIHLLQGFGAAIY